MDDIKLSFTFYLQESFSWSIPLNNDKTKYYLTHRNVATKVEGYYMVHGDRYECHENDCLMGWDFFRAHMSYPTNYWQAQIMTNLPDGRPFGVFLGDGIGSHLTDKESSEDFISLDGKIFKLGMTHLKEQEHNDLMSPKTLRTPEVEQFPGSQCSFAYSPIHKSETMVYAIFMAFN